MEKKLSWVAPIAAAGLLLVCLVPGAEPRSADYDFGKAEVIDRVILSVIEKYYDLSRVDSPAMFRATMDYLQKQVAEVTVREDEKAGRFTAELPGRRIDVDLADLKSPWGLSRSLRSIFRFLYDNLPPGEYDFQEVEYGAANALLSVLDPHSNALPPDIYEDLRMDTTGEFGGLGIRITTDQRPPCSGNLTVVDVFDGTPARRAGLKSGDRIVRIDDESTINITTSEAAQRLRGSPGSAVRIKVRRGAGETRAFELRRETIAIKSVTSEMLPGKVGYIALEGFQENSLSEFKAALAALHESGMKGLVFDLRNNPGGLLDSAIDIADLFLDSGTIVTTAGRGKGEQSVRNAESRGTEEPYPLAVLINAASASAAEIIAGALRNHGRALLIGQTTFGKGSVQMVRPMPGGGALKLTSAQYLTPGDVSIQATGVAPDVHFIPMTVGDKGVELGYASERFSEADLAAHLDRPSSSNGSRSDRRGILEGMLFVPAKERQADKAKYERCFVAERDRSPFVSRYEKEFARRLIAEAGGTTAGELLVQARGMLEKDNREHEKAEAQALRRLGVDWTADPAAPPALEKGEASDPLVSASARIVGEVAPGRSFRIEATVVNRSQRPVYRLRAVTKSDNIALDGREFAFGKIAPGARRSGSAVVEISPVAPARIDPVTIAFERQSGPLPAPVTVEVAVPKVPEPHLAYGWQFEDLGNANGLAEPGEELLVHLAVKNLGPGATSSAVAELSAKPGVDVVEGRLDLGKLLPGRTAEGFFRIKLSERFHMKEAELTFSVQDWLPARALTTRFLVNRQVKLPVSPVSPSPEAAAGTVTATAEAPVLREAPSGSSRAVADAVSGAAFQVDASLAGYFRVVLAKDRHAWIAASDTAPGGAARPRYSVRLLEAPEIRIEGDAVRKVAEDKAEIRGAAVHPERVRDLMVFVGERKLLYRPNPDPAKAQRIDFRLEVPLAKGDNFITVVARYDKEVYASVPIFVRRAAE